MSTYINKIKTNRFVGYLYEFLFDFGLSSSIWVLYLSSRGLSLIEIGILESIFHVTSFIFEIPTGAIADIYGRKVSILLSRISAIISTVFMITSNTMVGFAIGFIFSALSYNLNSGSFESLIYDSLKELNLSDKYKKISGNIFLIMEISQGLAVILGGILSDISFIYAYLATLVIQLLSLIAALFFTEPLIHEKEESRETFVSQIKNSLKVIWNKKTVFYLIVFFSLISTIGTTVFFYCQKYLDNMHFTKTEIALIYASSSLVNAFSSKLAYKIEKVIKAKGVIIITPILNIAALIGLALSSRYMTIIFFILNNFIDSFLNPIFSDYINSLIPSEYRATILSLESASFSIFMIVFFPLVGFLGEKVGLSAAFIVSALLFIPGIIFVVLKLQKSNS